MLSIRFRTVAWLTLPLLALTGCNYVHFGRIEPAVTDQQLTAENSDLRIQKKILQQELALARKEGDALRAVLENHAAPSGAAAEELTAKLNETTRELAALRVSYTRLQDERATLKTSPRGPGDNSTLTALEQVADVRLKLADTEEKLAATLRTYTMLQEENAHLRTEIDTVHTENEHLTTQVKDITAQYKEAQAALADLNTEFLAQKVARAQAEQDAEAVRAQLQAVMARPSIGATTSLASARETSATGARELSAHVSIDNLPNTENSTALLRTNQERLRTVANNTGKPVPTTAAPVTPATTTPARPAPPLIEASPAHTTRLHTVKHGETLESIAKEYYGRSDRWVLIYAANNALLSGGRPLKPGMQLDVPTE